MLSRGFVCWRRQLHSPRRSKPLPQKFLLSPKCISTGTEKRAIGTDDQTEDHRLRQHTGPPNLLQDVGNGESRLLELFLDGSVRAPPRPRPPARPNSAHERDEPTRPMQHERQPAQDRHSGPKGSCQASDDGSVIPVSMETAPAHKLNELLRNSEDLNQAWDHFLEHFGQIGCEARAHPAYRDLHLLRNNAIFGRMLVAMTKAWAAEPFSHPFNPVTTLKKLEDVAASNPDFHLEAGWTVLQELIRLDGDKFVSTPNRKRNVLISELLDIWAGIVMMKSDMDSKSSTNRQIPGPDWKNLEVSARSLLDEGLRPPDSWVELRLEKILDRKSLFSRKSLSALALASYDVFSRYGDDAALSSQHREHSVGFVRVMALVIHRRPVRSLLKHIRQKFAESSTKLSPKLISNYVSRLGSLSRFTYASLAQRTNLSSLTTGQDNDHARLESNGPVSQRHATSTLGPDKMFALLIKNAGKHHYGSRLDIVWENIVKCYADLSRGAKHVKISRHIYRLILCEFLALKKSDQATKVLEFMRRNDEELTVKEYTAMMDGCRRSKSYTSVESLWVEMTAKGLQPDSQAWNARISALLSAGLQREAIAALDTMQNAWLAAVAKHAASPDKLPTLGDMPEAVKPHIVNVNAVLSGFAKGPKQPSNFSDAILQWALDIGLKPDAVTYTILVQQAIMKHEFSKAAEYLEQMAASGIEPTAQLFSIILRESFRRTAYQKLSAEESERHTLTIISRLEQYGWNKNRVIFQILIDCLLKQHTNYDAAMTVVRYMNCMGIEPSEHTYTSLITFHFAQDPPNIDAVDSTVQKMTGPGMKGFMDDYLFDRIVEGYAKCGEVEKIRHMLRRLSNQGRKSSWSALTESLSAFVAARRFDLVSEMVADLEKRKFLRWSHFAKDNVKSVEGAESGFLARIQQLRMEQYIAPAL